MVTIKDIEAQLDRFATLTRAGADTTSARALVLSSVALLVEQVAAERDSAANRIVDEYRRLAREARDHA